jgi:hypothetical protein
MDVDIWGRKATRKVVDMACKQERTGLFGEDVRGVETQRNIFKRDKVSIGANFNVAGLFCGLGSTGHQESAPIVLVKSS